MKKLISFVAMTLASAAGFAQTFEFQTAPDRSWARNTIQSYVGSASRGAFSGVTASMRAGGEYEFPYTGTEDEGKGRGKAGGIVTYEYTSLLPPTWLSFPTDNERSADYYVRNYGHDDPQYSFKYWWDSEWTKYEDTQSHALIDPVPSTTPYLWQTNPEADDFILSVPVTAVANTESVAGLVDVHGPQMRFETRWERNGLNKRFGQEMYNDYTFNTPTEHMSMPKYAEISSIPEAKVVALLLYSSVDPDPVNIVEMSMLDKDLGRFPIVSSGTYWYEIRADGYLTAQGSLTIGSTPISLSYTAVGGDVNSDNSVDLLDYFYMSASFNMTAFDPTWLTDLDWTGVRPVDSDINDDDVVDLLDYFILSDGYNLSGPDIWL